jgi:cell wall assembly regulator SMI1
MTDEPDRKSSVLKKYLWRLVYIAALLPALFDWRSLFLLEPQPVMSDVQRPAPTTTADWMALRQKIEARWESISDVTSREYGAWPKRPCDEYQLRRVERAERRPFPIQYRELLMVHDGMHEAGTPIAILPILEAEDQTSNALGIAAENDHDLGEHLDEGDWWNTRMFMLSDYDSGEGQILDLATGNVRNWSHDGGLFRKEHDDCLGWMKAFEDRLIDYAR